MSKCPKLLSKDNVSVSVLQLLSKDNVLVSIPQKVKGQCVSKCSTTFCQRTMC